ncbi:hypothetical protein HRI_001493500 [Hibiscus trionum]|uniref:Uncharacterized protein n=1 Tax=Hibiscus trionum TaxID=183268 RepID=A0A9W7LUN3_HIBTR|nr:hypothetical protein HRI_001493500 [Hibiscus trionum]
MESAHLTVSYLGDLGLLQFKDLNSDKSPFQRTYAAQGQDLYKSKQVRDKQIARILGKAPIINNFQGQPVLQAQPSVSSSAGHFFHTTCRT